MSRYFFNPTTRKLPTKTGTATTKVSTFTKQKKNAKTTKDSSLLRKQQHSSTQIPVLNRKPKANVGYLPGCKLSNVTKKQLCGDLNQKLKIAENNKSNENDENKNDIENSKRNNLINITVGIYDEFMESTIDTSTSNNLQSWIGDNSEVDSVQNIDYFLNKDSDVNSMLKPSNGNDDPDTTTTTTTVVLILACGENYLLKNSNLLKQIVSNYPLLNSTFSYYCVEQDNPIGAKEERSTGDKDRVFDLLNLESDRRLSIRSTSSSVDQFNSDQISKRKICSIEYIADLVKLGNFNYIQNLQQQPQPTDLDNNKLTTQFIFQFDYPTKDHKSIEIHQSQQITKETNNKFYLVDFNVRWNDDCVKSTEVSLGKTLQEMENCIRTIQRGKYPVSKDSSILTKIFKDTVFVQNSNCNLYVIGIVSTDNQQPKRTKNEFSNCLVKYLKRLKRYGTEDDDFDEFILLKNESLIEDLRTPMKQHQTMDRDIYLYLLNNLSLLQTELLETHKNFNDAMEKWFDNHKFLNQLTINSNPLNDNSSNKNNKNNDNDDSNDFDVENYTGKMMELLMDQALKIDQLIASIDNFNTGLNQLKQSVN